jgi:beta-lactam-binding protein with PASTA domain
MRNTVAVTNSKYGGGSFPDPPSEFLTGSGINIPDLKGQTPEAAKALLEALGFGYLDGGPVDSEVAAGKVAGTDPAAGSQSGTGAVVTVFTSKGNKVLVPDESGQTSAAAHADLTSKGFTNHAAAQDQCAVLTPPLVLPVDPREGKVQSQSPAGGAAALPTDPITLTIGKAVCP